jgi:hypothetical protein
MHRLVLLVVGAGERHVGEPVEGQHVVGLRVGDRLCRVGLLQGGVVGLAVLQGAEERDAEQLVEPHVEAAQRQPADEPELRPQRLDVLHPGKVLVDPGAAIRLLVGDQLVALAAVLHRGERRFGRQHAGLHGVVGAFYARHVDEAGRAADQRPAGERQLRHRLQPPSVIARAP